jgi:hypothetical protein
VFLTAANTSRQHASSNKHTQFYDVAFRVRGFVTTLVVCDVSRTSAALSWSCFNVGSSRGAKLSCEVGRIIALAGSLRNHLRGALQEEASILRSLGFKDALGLGGRRGSIARGGTEQAKRPRNWLIRFLASSLGWSLRVGAMCWKPIAVAIGYGHLLWRKRRDCRRV